MRTAIRLGGVLLGIVTAVPALAQESEDDERGATVTDREHQNEVTLGVRLGAFTVLPTVTADATFDDNIFATDTGRKSDGYLTLHPEIAVRSDMRRASLNARLFYERDFHAHYSSENVSQYGLSADGRYDLAADTSVSVTTALNRSAESRTSLGSFRQTTSPALFTSLQGDVTVTQKVGDLSLSATGRIRRLSYSDANLGGLSVSQRYRNLSIYSGTAQAGFAIRELTKLFVQAEVERRRYDLRPGDTGFDPLTLTDRSADGYRVELGVTREVTSLILATVRLGYLSYDYADTRLRNVSGFSYFGNLRWNITSLTTISGTAQRRLDETTSPVTAGNLRDEIQLQVDHELLRQLILTGDVRYAGIKPAGLSASSREFEIGFGGRYYAGRSIRLEANATHSARGSSDRGIAFKSNQLTLGARIAL